MSLLRTALERLSRHRVIKRRFSSRFNHVPLMVTPDSALKYAFRKNLDAVDPLLLDVVDKHIKAGDVVWDAGANVGLLSFAAATRVGPTGQVLAMEPDPFLCHLLTSSCRLPDNQNLKVNVLPVAVSDHIGILTLAIGKRGRSSNHLVGLKGSAETGGQRALQLCMSIHLDAVLDQMGHGPNFLKIDVEGAELMVLQGAREVLKSYRPIIHCEVSLHHRQEVADLLLAHGYELFDAQQPHEAQTPLPTASYNTLAIPH